MIALICTMLRERRFQAITLTLLASIAFAAAIGLPAYLSAVDRSAIATEIGHATRDERLIETQNLVTSPGSRQPDFGTTVPAAMSAPSLSVTYAIQTTVDVLLLPTVSPLMQFRQDVCAHVVIESGRCPLGSGEVMIDPALAKSKSLQVGSSVPIVYVLYVPPLPGHLPGFKRLPGYAATTVNVVGIYRPRDVNEAYWGDESLFQPSSQRGADAPIFTTAGTFAAMKIGDYVEYVDAVIRPSALTPDRLPQVAAQVKHATGVVFGSNVRPTSDMPNLLANIDADRAGAREYLPIMAFPMIGIGWLVVFLASAYAISGRREELGVVALRGVRLGSRWWTGIGEALASILIAVPCGYLLASVAVRLAVRFLIPNHVAVPAIGPGSLTYVAVTFVGCVLAILAAAWRPLRTPAAELLRGVPPKAARWRTAAIEMLVVIAAVILVDQMRRQSGRLVGFDQIAPAVAIGAVAIVAARVVMPLARTVGRIGVRRGRRSIGIGIGALQIARRPGASRLFVLMTIAVGMVTYAAAGASVANAARADRASVESGANTVVSIGDVTRRGLLDAVRKADPGGRDAMAVARIPQATESEPPLLAVDASRLAAIASWPRGLISVSRAAAMLRPNVSKPVIATGALLSATITARDTAGGVPAPPQVSIYIEPANGGPAQQAYFTAVKHGSTTYTSPVTCDQGCRIASLDIEDRDASGDSVTVTIHPVRVAVPAGSTVPGFTSAASWEALQDPFTSETPDLSEKSGNLVVTAQSGNDGTRAHLIAADTTNPVPVLSTRAHPGLSVGAVGMDRIPVPIRVAATVPELPGLPDGGIIMDLQNADGAVPVAEDDAFQPQVWLSAAAPPAILGKLTAAGLTILSVAHERSQFVYLGRQGTPVAATFSLVAVVGILLMTIGAMILTSSVDRIRRGTELRWLRVQGLSSRSVRSAASFAYVGLAVVAALAGLVAGLVSWRLTGAKTPVFVDDHPIAGVSVWPAPAGLLWPWIGATLVLFVISGAAAWDLRRFVRRVAPGGQSGR